MPADGTDPAPDVLTQIRTVLADATIGDGEKVARLAELLGVAPPTPGQVEEARASADFLAKITGQPAPGGDPLLESASGRKLERLRRENAALRLCVEANINPIPAFVKALAGLDTDADRHLLIEDYKGSKGIGSSPPNRPRSSSPHNRLNGLYR